MNRNLKIVYFDKLDLGKEYLLHFTELKWCKKPKRVKFIKVTAKGYNFLDIETNKCIFKRHFYIWKDGKMIMHKSLRITNFEIQTELDEEKFINLEPVIK